MEFGETWRHKRLFAFGFWPPERARFWARFGAESGVRLNEPLLRVRHRGGDEGSVLQ